MYNYRIIEQWYKKLIDSLDSWINLENMIVVDIELLKELNLLDYTKPHETDPIEHRTFHSLETNEKITLINNDFIIWIVPETDDDFQTTYTFIAHNVNGTPHLECILIQGGIYNCSQIVLGVLEKYLCDIDENEKLIKKLV